jgi:hypothetical protein
MFEEVLLISLFTGAAALITTTGTLGIKNIAKHSNKVDVFITLMAVWLSSDTATYGILIGVMTGLWSAIYTKSVRAYWKWASSHGFLSPLNENEVDWQRAKSYAKDVMSDLMAPANR